jgi:hypothetical protein
MKVVVFTFFFFATLLGRCDSPLTSTEFYLAYQHPIIEKAIKRKGIPIDKELMNFLFQGTNSLELKVALINALGWNYKGQKNAARFLSYLVKQKRCIGLTDLMNSQQSDLILCYAYLLALDNYFQVEDAKRFAQKAVELNQKSYTTLIITALIEAQEALNTDWCEVYHATDRVRQMEGLIVDMNEQAIQKIFEYMDIYSDSCSS